ncbi:homocysteine-responsive endoplasmic reticulum-resident ubiquitin-like domain member 2 protein [Drosophila nasuta]|uniref:homocysteine-responsive endoplasmic reticulum-resident ubiquitin-like domain member 2 protein n=1 Tax=Drosophila nasuta TaxID=42062 RepID=UPI00295EEF5E|nr:homocysteine-responsive endoplasmic reticulum-resident ubiquitin-like domain member 2 protein [Drosophila nasuta]
MDDSSTATTPSPSPAAATAAGYDAARDKTTTTTAGSSAAGSNTGSGSGVSSIRLLIKSSNQQYDDMNIESDLCWTVERLKKQLSMVYPGKPEIKDQKLIYSGKLVNDTQKLSEVIRSYKDVYQQHHIFHLVCVNRSLTKPPYKAMTTPAKDNGVNANTNTNATANANVNATPRLETNNTNDNELRQRHVSTTAAAAAAQIPYQQLQQQPQQQQQQQYPWMQHLTDPNMQNHAYHLAAYQAAAAAAYGAVNVSTMTHLTQEQQQALLTNAWIQHCYAQYMQQVMQRPSGAQNAGPALPMLHPLLQNMPVIPHMMSVPQADPAAVPAGAAAAAQAANEAAAAGLQPAAAAAAGRQVDGPNFVNIQEEPEMRDWLDSFFSFTRLAIFATVLYFNSSPMRCLLVLLIASGIYLYHIGILRRRRERNNNNINRNNNAGNDAAAFAAVQQIQRMMDAAVERDNNPQAAAEPAPAAPAGQDADEAAAATPAAASAAGGADQADAAEAAAVAAAVVEPANANNSVISIVRTFVITFFTSLLPEAPAL